MSPYRRPVPTTWWLQRRSYTLFILREITSVFVAGYCILLLYLLHRLGRGPEGYEAALTAIGSPVSVALHVMALLFVLYHTVTWFNLTPKVMVVRVGEEQVSPLLIAGGVYAGWIVVSVLIAWIIFGV